MVGLWIDSKGSVREGLREGGGRASVCYQWQT